MSLTVNDAYEIMKIALEEGLEPVVSNEDVEIYETYIDAHFGHVGCFSSVHDRSTTLMFKVHDIRILHKGIEADYGDGVIYLLAIGNERGEFYVTSSSNHIEHPHAPQKFMCSGSWRDYWYEAASIKDLKGLLHLLVKSLNAYTPTDAYNLLDAFHCSCDNPTPGEEQCSSCGAYVCDYCKYFCYNCMEGIYCQSCIIECEECGYKSCSDCIVKCEGCENQFCRRCIPGNQTVCPYCKKECDFCGTTIEQGEPCDECGNYACEECECGCTSRQERDSKEDQRRGYPPF